MLNLVLLMEMDGLSITDNNGVIHPAWLCIDGVIVSHLVHLSELLIKDDEGIRTISHELGRELGYELNDVNTSEIRKENLINLYNDKGEQHGYWERYFDNGKLESKGNYVNDNQDGYWEYYLDNGQLIYKGNYVNGKQHGYWEYYYNNGQLCYKGNYVNGNKHGYWEFYYRNGELDSKGYYDMGKQLNYNPDEPKVIELTLTDIANKLGVDVDKLRIKE